MPRYSDDTILQKAIEPACRDRESLADAYAEEAPERAEVLETCKDIAKLRGRKFADLNEAERHTAMLALLYADQWETGYADSKPGRPYEQKALAAAQRFREVRLRRYGRTKLEAIIASSVPVLLQDIK